MSSYITGFYSSTGVLCKQFSLDPEGNLQKTSAPNFYAGRAHTVSIANLTALKELQSRLKHADALAYGVFKDMPEKVDVGTLSNPKDGTVARCRDQMQWPQGAGIMMLDIDPDGMPDALRSRLDANPIGLVVEALPELNGISILSTASASSHIYQGEKCLKGKGGVHVYLEVDNAQEIPRIGEIFAKRLWLRGYGFIRISRTGALLVRQLVDSLVWQPERLDFAAGAKCLQGLEQRRPPGLIIEGDILKAERIEPLSTNEEVQYEALVATAKQANKDGAETVREGYIAQQADKLVSQGNASDLQAARAIVQSRITLSAGGHFELQPLDRLQFDDPKLGIKSVAEVLANPATYHEKTLADPHEPEEGRCKAKLYANPNGSVMVHSMAHGAGNVFVLMPFESTAGPDPLAWRYKHMITEEDAKTFDNPDFAYDDFIVNGHLIVIAGEANSGKSSIMLRLVCPVMVKRGYQVIYINVDVACVDTRDMLQQANTDGIDLLVPEVAGQGVEDVIDHLDKMSRGAITLSHTVIVLDTLKKFADLISKTETRKLLSMLRRLTSKGVTVICLAHTNKRPDANGKLLFEGVGDIKNDVDELIYLASNKQDDGTVVVSAKPDKTRARITPLAFKIEQDRSVTPTQPVDIQDHKQKADQFAKDQNVIQAITDLLKKGECNQTQILNSLHPQGISSRQVRRVLQSYADPKAYAVLWTKDKLAKQALYALKTQEAVCTPQCGECASGQTVHGDQTDQGDQTVQTQQMPELDHSDRSDHFYTPTHFDHTAPDPEAGGTEDPLDPNLEREFLVYQDDDATADESGIV